MKAEDFKIEVVRFIQQHGDRVPRQAKVCQSTYYNIVNSLRENDSYSFARREFFDTFIIIDHKMPDGKVIIEERK